MKEVYAYVHTLQINQSNASLGSHDVAAGNLAVNCRRWEIINLFKIDRAFQRICDDEGELVRVRILVFPSCEIASRQTDKKLRQIEAKSNSL